MSIPAVETNISPPRGSESAGAGGIRVDVATSFASGAPDRATWNRLTELSGGTVYQTHEWQSLWWESFGKGGKLHIVVFRDGEGVAGIAPLFVGAGRSPGARALRFLGSGGAFSRSGGMFADDGPSDYLDLIVDPARGEDVARAFVGHLRANAAKFGSIDLVNLRADGPAVRFVLPALSAAPDLEVSCSDGDPCYAIGVSAPTEEFLRSLGASARRRYGQARRLLGGGDGTGAGPAFRTIEPASWDATYADLVRLHQARWNRMGFAGVFHDGASREFQERIAKALHERGLLWYGSLYDGGRCIAARLGFVFGGRMYDYLSGFDDASPWAKKRPGMALILRMYDEARANGLATLDLLRGDEPYKAELTAERSVLRNVAIRPRSGGSGGILRAASSAAGLATFLLGREMRLLGVQLRQHGIFSALRHYIEFRSKRLMNKYRNGKDGISHG